MAAAANANTVGAHLGHRELMLRFISIKFISKFPRTRLRQRRYAETAMNPPRISNTGFGCNFAVWCET
jgi:hypothetical protein